MDQMDNQKHSNVTAIVFLKRRVRNFLGQPRVREHIANKIREEMIVDQRTRKMCKNHVYRPCKYICFVLSTEATLRSKFYSNLTCNRLQ